MCVDDVVFTRNALRRSAHYACSIVSIARRERNCRGRLRNFVKRIRTPPCLRNHRAHNLQVLKVRRLLQFRRLNPRLHHPQLHETTCLTPNRQWTNHSCCLGIGCVTSIHHVPRFFHFNYHVYRVKATMLSTSFGR